MLTADQLARLEYIAYLKNKGVLTDAEFQAQKKALLMGKSLRVDTSKPARSNEIMLLVLAVITLFSAIYAFVRHT